MQEQAEPYVKELDGHDVSIDTSVDPSIPRIYIRNQTSHKLGRHQPQTIKPMPARQTIKLQNSMRLLSLI